MVNPGAIAPMVMVKRRKVISERTISSSSGWGLATLPDGRPRMHEVLQVGPEQHEGHLEAEDLQPTGGGARATADEGEGRRTA